VDDPGDIAERAIRICLIGRLARGVDVAEDDAPLSLELGEGLLVAEVVPVAVSDRYRDELPALVAAREDRVVPLDAQRDVTADEREAPVAQKRAGQQARLAEDLEAVADAEHVAAPPGKLGDRAHDRRV